MRCAEAILSLGESPGGPRPAGLAEHLDACPRCTEWAKRLDRLARLWEATCPAEPSPAAWDTIWARVVDAADHAPSPVPARTLTLVSPDEVPASRWRRSALVALGIVQAAAVLLVGATLAIRHGQAPVDRPRPPQVAQNAPTVAKVEVDIEYGRTVFIQSDPKGRTVVRVEAEEGSVAFADSAPVGWNFAALGKFEAMGQ